MDLLSFLIWKGNNYLSRQDYFFFFLQFIWKVVVVNQATHVEHNLTNITDNLHNSENLCCILPLGELQL